MLQQKKGVRNPEKKQVEKKQVEEKLTAKPAAVYSESGFFQGVASNIWIFEYSTIKAKNNIRMLETNIRIRSNV